MALVVPRSPERPHPIMLAGSTQPHLSRHQARMAVQGVAGLAKGVSGGLASKLCFAHLGRAAASWMKGPVL